MKKDCIFCKIVKGEIPSNKVLETKNFIVIEDIHPKVVGHSLVIPKKHYETFLDLPEELYKDLLKTTEKSIKKLMKKNESAGFNLITNNGKIAGQVVLHLHLHILPRKNGDGYILGI